jgi:proteasome accessory factor B
MLQAASGHNVESLAQECRVTRRTIFRDLRDIRGAGLPLEFDEETRVYHVPSRFFPPQFGITADEALAVLTVCHDRNGAAKQPLRTHARQAAEKFEMGLPPGVKLKLKHRARAVEILRKPARFLEDFESAFEQLIAAAAERLCVRIGYDSVSDGGTISTKLSPYRLLQSRHSWYVIGRSSRHRAVRTFNVGRIVRCEVLEESFRIPRGFSIDRYLGNAWHLIRGEGPDQEVLIRFQPLVARNVAEVRWHKTQRQQLNEDGTLDFRVTVSGLWEISWWILSYGDQAEVLEPAELRQLIAERVSRMATIYTARPADENPPATGEGEK